MVGVAMEQRGVRAEAPRKKAVRQHIAAGAAGGVRLPYPFGVREPCSRTPKRGLLRLYFSFCERYGFSPSAWRVVEKKKEAVRGSHRLMYTEEVRRGNLFPWALSPVRW